METLENLYFGNQLTAQEPLVKRGLSAVFHHIQTGSDGLAEQTQRLRRIQALDPKSYQGLKTHLPYFIGASFREGIRRTDHLEAVFACVLDLDHLHQPERLQELKRYLAGLPEVALAYTSPGGQGIKLLFGLDHPFEDPALYRQFYKAFASAFASRHGLNAWIDLKTCDAARITFLAHDPEALCRPDATPLSTAPYLDAGFPLSHLSAQSAPAETQVKEPEGAVYRKIADTLRPIERKKPSKPEQPIPGMVAYLQPAWAKAVEDHQMVVIEQRGIQYGLKIRVKHERGGEAEVNVFYGKHGFSVVQSPKNGTHPDLNQVLEQLIWMVINDHWNQQGDATVIPLQPHG
jgi:hypothetical protein